MNGFSSHTVLSLFTHCVVSSQGGEGVSCWGTKGRRQVHLGLCCHHTGPQGQNRTQSTAESGSLCYLKFTDRQQVRLTDREGDRQVTQVCPHLWCCIASSPAGQEGDRRNQGEGGASLRRTDLCRGRHSLDRPLKTRNRKSEHPQPPLHSDWPSCVVAAIVSKQSQPLSGRLVRADD